MKYVSFKVIQSDKQNINLPVLLAIVIVRMHTKQLICLKSLSIGTVYAGDKEPSPEHAYAYFSLFQMLGRGYKKIRANVLQSHQSTSFIFI